MATYTLGARTRQSTAAGCSSTNPTRISIATRNKELYASLLREHTRRTIVLVSHDEQLELPSGAKILNIE